VQQVLMGGCSFGGSRFLSPRKTFAPGLPDFDSRRPAQGEPYEDRYLRFVRLEDAGPGVPRCLLGVMCKKGRATRAPSGW
jgi:hypothetical protein